MKFGKILIKSCRHRRVIVRFLHKPILGWNEPHYTLTPKDVFAIENHWHDKVTQPNNQNGIKGKKYVLSMFPYPSGNLHMGHVRVYTIADCIARYYALKGYQVFQPMGWDAFGLPAENAAIERKENPSDWTRKNVDIMREQLKRLSCRFDWDSELFTCNPDYYRWTQWIFLQLYKNGLAYMRKSYVNWDPVDRTVIASEQIDSEGKSWRSGALVERKLLNQWFIRTTKYAKALYDNLDTLPDWKDIVAIQRNWLGECHVHRFTLDLYDVNNKKIGDVIDLCLKNPIDFGRGLFVALKRENPLIQNYPNRRPLNGVELLLNVTAKNPITDRLMPLIIMNNDELFEKHQICKLGVSNSEDSSIYKQIFPEKELPDPVNTDNETILKRAEAENWGGYVSSYRLNDWVVSRQRYWGTPIPMIHCEKCGAVPVPESDLPVILPKIADLNELLAKNRPIGDAGAMTSSTTTVAVSPLAALDQWTSVTCPQCSGPARRETDTLDTFFDSSFYYLRFLDSTNPNELCQRVKTDHWMPVDVYVGGKEHACLHLYFARFVCHFLHAIGVSPVKEPFSRLLPQGMVMGQTYRNPKTGHYVPKERAKVQSDKSIIDSQTGELLEATFEKMSKSKFNGVDPLTIFDQYGSDMARLLMIGFVCPQAHRNWSSEFGRFKGLHRWLNRVAYVVQNYVLERRKMVDNGQLLVARQKNSDPVEKSLKDQYNRCVQKLTFHHHTTFLLNTALVELIVLTTALRKMPVEVYGTSPQFERCLHSLIIMCSPLMPHMSAEFWSALRLVPALNAELWNKEQEVWEQKWPESDEDALMQLVFWVDDEAIDFVMIDRRKLDDVTVDQALQLVGKSSRVKKYLAGRKIFGLNLEKLEFLGLRATLNVEPAEIDPKNLKKKAGVSMDDEESESEQAVSN